MITGWAGVRISDAQLFTDVQVACNYTGGEVRVVMPHDRELAEELLSDTCVGQWRRCSRRGTPEKILIWHGRGGRCAIYLRAEGSYWYSATTGFCGPTAAGRVIVDLDWPPPGVSTPALCAWDHTHPICLLEAWATAWPDRPVPWHGDCPPRWLRERDVCHPPVPLHLETEEVVESWDWSWGPDSKHPGSVALPLRTWGPSTVSTPLSPWDYERHMGIAGRPVGRDERPPAPVEEEEPDEEEVDLLEGEE